MKFSSRLTRKGALIDETQIVFRRWDERRSIKANIRAALIDNPIGAASQGWLSEVASTLSSRLSEMGDGELAALASLAQSEISSQVWRACFHWHCARTDFLYYHFATEWLFGEYRRGTHLIRSQDLVPFVKQQVVAAKGRGAKLSEYGVLRAARDLLRTAAHFGLLRGTVVKEFTSYHLPEESFLYLLHAMAEREPNARRIVDSIDWHMFLMDSSDVEREVLRLHQFRKLHYEVAGSLAQLQLPHASPASYARGLCA